jgi:hypothetical protein
MKLARLGPLALSATLLGTSCGNDDPEREIRATVAAAAAAVESRDVGFFRDFVATAYHDSRGNDREQLLNLVRGYFIAHQRIAIVSRVEEVRLEGSDAAHAVVHAGLAGQRVDESLLSGVGADVYRFDIELVDDGGKWRIIGAQWQREVGE